MIRGALLACALVLAAVGCSDGGGEGSSIGSSAGQVGSGASAADVLSSVTTAPAPDGVGASWGREARGRSALAGFGEVAAVITAADGTECEVCLLAAVSGEQTSHGLMFVTDEELGGYDGMLFAFEEEVASGFWMRNTRMPLSIAYFDGDGVLVSQTDMEPCPDDEQNCPVYAATAPFRFALEVPQGRLADVGVIGADGGPAVTGDATIVLTGIECPDEGGATGSSSTAPAEG